MESMETQDLPEIITLGLPQSAQNLTHSAWHRASTRDCWLLLTMISISIFTNFSLIFTNFSLI